MKLTEIVEAVENHDVNLDYWVRNYPEALRITVLMTNYYWGLGAYVDLFKVKRVLELGTCTGASAIIMHSGGALVDTWDLDGNKWEMNEFPEGVIRHVAQTPDEVRAVDLSPYELIFVDIAHEGPEEQKWHEKFVAEYRGVVMYDDIWLNAGMRAFWDGIQQEKVATRWHGKYGFGLVRY